MTYNTPLNADELKSELRSNRYIKINASSLRASIVGIFVAGLYIGFIVRGLL